MIENGWTESASAWIDVQGEDGDFGRRFVLDAPMMSRIRGRGFASALDVGCGEGRFCRMLAAEGIRTIGIDPTERLLCRAREKDPAGDYRDGRAERLEFADESFDLVVSYLTLVDIPDIHNALAEMVRVLKPGGTLLIANLNSFNTAGPPRGWMKDADGNPRFYIDNYLEERPEWYEWLGIRVRNWHRPLSLYMRILLGHGLQLRYFDEPAPYGGDPLKIERHRRVPHFLVMDWQKPAL
ncbi:class I SAM-dependent methyltransferase [Phyllobacterium sp. 21LDTY02-6]|jgi:SAM-dependent methyltransferase|uniref:class I SAM-dependent methyltransferase n=1 Tax=Phyllobacterium sp. 21LDTY02-6 TaxID=2944903 RepID=UPI00201FFA65|nr:class I SAM-dependent methyltransferase [Phyllobacterium sp. 21LDTY02-6]MCO4318401.1 class I SAM-dependent methyltransferase [Phyllobacterium sp. 21LDTY02-6]